MKKRGKKKLDGFAQVAGKEVLVKAVPWAVGIGLLYLLVLKPIMQKVGIIQSPEDKALENQTVGNSADPNSPFSPTYYKQVAGAVLVTKAKAEELASQIFEADDMWNDDETEVFAALRQLSHKTQVSWVADNFNRLYKADLYQFMRAFMDDSEMIIAHGIVNNMK